PTNLWEHVATTNPASLQERLSEERRKQHTPIVELLSFALMPNHYHFIIREIKDGGIIEFMRKLGGYTLYFNQQYERVGPLFQSRYRAVHIKDDTQLKIAFAYVHTNPVELIEPNWKEQKIKDPRRAFDWLNEYQWSSYGDYLGIKRFPEATQRNFFLDVLNGAKGCQRWIEDWIKYKAQRFKTEIVDFE
ncbi:MAG: transposase, partial [Parcubacteria group bacterium]|nr:transposase [Parcubacteria group bacterium]